MYGFVEIIKTNAKTNDSIDRGYGLHSSESRGIRKPIESGGYVLDYIEPSDEEAAAIMEEAAGWVIEDHYDYKDYHEVYDINDNDSGVRTYDIAKGASYVIVKDGHFHGVALCIENTSGNGWHGSSAESYCLQFIDGNIVGNNKKRYSFSGEEYETDKIDIYYLKKNKTEDQK